MYGGGTRTSTNTLSCEDAEESVQKNLRQLQEQIQIKNDNLSIIFQKISKLEHLSNIMVRMSGSCRREQN